MRAHKAIDIIVVMPELIQETHCKSSLPIVLVDYELSNPTYSFVIVFPAASERVTGKAPVDGNPHVRAWGVIRQVLGSKSFLTESYLTALSFSAGKPNR